MTTDSTMSCTIIMMIALTCIIKQALYKVVRYSGRCNTLNWSNNHSYLYRCICCYRNLIQFVNAYRRIVHDAIITLISFSVFNILLVAAAVGCTKWVVGDEYNSLGTGMCWGSGLASSPGSPIFFNARERKEGEPGIQCHVRDVGPYPFRSQKIHELTQQAFVRYRVDQAAVVAGKPNEPRPNYRSLQRVAQDAAKMQPRERMQAK